MDDQTLETYAEFAAQQAVAQYGFYVRNLGLTREEFKKLVTKVAEHAVKIIDRQPA